jgi:hypothetical protein
VPHLQIVTVEGEALWPMEFAVPHWPAGSVSYRGAEPNVRVVDVIASDDPRAVHRARRRAGLNT